MSTRIQTVVVKKSPQTATPEAAFDLAKSIVKRIVKTPVHITPTSYRWRQLAPSRIKKGSYKTKVINDLLSIVYGKKK